MNASRIDVSADDGTTLGLHVAKPDGAPRAAIMVLQEIFGVNAHMRDVADRFAKLGYLTVVPDLFHRQGAWWESGYADIAPGVQRAQALTQDQIRSDLRATHAWVSKELPQAKVSAVGFCMGGRQAFVANGILPLACAVSFYGSNIPGLADLAAKQSGPIALLWGGMDKGIDVAQRRAVADLLIEAKKTYAELTFGDANHGFFCDARSQHHPASAKQAWAFVKAFLEENLA
jgi:carboxymethylenebutenolidase